MFRKIVVLAILVSIVEVGGIAASVFAQEKAELQSQQLSGEVVSVDVTKSEIVVKKVKAPTLGTYENVTVKVAPDTKITKENVVIQLSDVKASDKVTIKFTTDSAGNNKAESIAISAK